MSHSAPRSTTSMSGPRAAPPSASTAAGAATSTTKSATNKPATTPATPTPTSTATPECHWHGPACERTQVRVTYQTSHEEQTRQRNHVRDGEAHDAQEIGRGR